MKKDKKLKYAINCKNINQSNNKITLQIQNDNNTPNQSNFSICVFTETDQRSINDFKIYKSLKKSHPSPDEKSIKSLRLISGMYNKRIVKNEYERTHYYFPRSSLQNKISKEIGRISPQYEQLYNKNKLNDKINNNIFNNINNFDIYYKCRLLERASKNTLSKPRLKNLITTDNTNRLEILAKRIFYLNKSKYK